MAKPKRNTRDFLDHLKEKLSRDLAQAEEKIAALRKMFNLPRKRPRTVRRKKRRK